MKLVKIFAVLLPLLCLLGCEQEKGTPVSITNKTELSFLVNNSDLIAIIEITKAPSKGPNSKLSTAKIATAEILDKFTGDFQRKIKIKNSPYFKASGATFHISLLRKGKYFAFLKQLKGRKNIYVPLTGSALLSIFDGKVQPIWKIDEPKYAGNGLELEDIVNSLRKIQGDISRRRMRDIYPD